MSASKRQKGIKCKRASEAEEEPEKELENGLEFEDPYGDDLDEEEQQQLQQLLRKQQKKQSSSSSSSKRAAAAAAEDQEDEWSDVSDAAEMQTDEDEENEQPVKMWRPGVDTLGEGEVLECDSSAYELLHRLQTAWPCLSFDFIPDQLGAARTRCPHTCYAVGGTQSDGKENCLYIMKWDRLHKTQHDDSSSLSGESSDEDDTGEDAKLDFRLIAHKGAVNRIRCCPQMPRLVAAWSDLGVVGVWDIEKHLKRLDEPGAAGPPPDPHQKPTFEFKGHGTEGFAMDWNPLHLGKLLTGDVKGQAFLWLPKEGGWSVEDLFKILKKKNKNKNPNQNPNKNPNSTLEELKWKPREDGQGEIFAAASNDGTIKLFDLRVGVSVHPAALLGPHNSDVNSISFSFQNPNLVLAGLEEGLVVATDLRCPQMPLAQIDWHKKPITCVEWHPSEEGVFAAASLDDSLTFWDLSVEREEPAEVQTAAAAVPEQLMFVHGGQQQISEFHFHPQIPGFVAATASDGFSIFKTCNI